MNQDENKPMLTYEYAVKDAEYNANIEIISAIASPTSLNVKLIVDTNPFENEVRFMKVIDEAGVEYEAMSRHLDTQPDKRRLI